jgi:hypothetical protein
MHIQLQPCPIWGTCPRRLVVQSCGLGTAVCCDLAKPASRAGKQTPERQVETQPDIGLSVRKQVARHAAAICTASIQFTITTMLAYVLIPSSQPSHSLLLAWWPCQLAPRWASQLQNALDHRRHPVLCLQRASHISYRPLLLFNCWHGQYACQDRLAPRMRSIITTSLDDHQLCQVCALHLICFERRACIPI